MSKVVHAALMISLAIFACGSGVCAQDVPPLTEEDRLRDPVYLSWISYESVGSCVRCHINGNTIDERLSGQLSKFSRRREMQLWLREDKHAIARQRVEPITTDQIEQKIEDLFKWVDGKRQLLDTDPAKKDQNDDQQEGQTPEPTDVNVDLATIRQWFGSSNQLSRRICDKLYGDDAVETDEGYERFRSECLTCHGGYSNGSSGFEREASLDQKQLGISCLYCHETEPNLGWIEEHLNFAKWRLKPPLDKAAKGMADLTNTAKQVQLCVDCHVGNRDKGMFVSHEMYAAGHPPLPPIEAQTFCEKLPRHWQTPSQLFENTIGEPDQEKYFQINFPGLPVASVDQAFWNTRKLLIGALVAKKQYLALLIQSANGDEWGDYALYDCSACHHELRAASFRQSLRTPGHPGHLGAPGRPRPYDWTQPLLPIAYRMDGAERYAKIVQLEKSLEQSFGETPFGDRMRTSSIAGELKNEIDAVLLRAQTRMIDDNIAKRILETLMATPDAAVLSYDAARQIAWAGQVIVDELAGHGSLTAENLSTKIKAIGEPSVSGVATSLPSGRSNFIYPDSLKAELGRRSSYDARVFIDHLRTIGNSLK